MVEQDRKLLTELVVVTVFGIRNRQVSGSIPLVGSTRLKLNTSKLLGILSVPYRSSPTDDVILSRF